MRILALVAVLPLLAGCTDGDWRRLTSFGSTDRQDVAAAAEPMAVPAPAPAAPAGPGPNPFCLGVARGDTSGHGFDQATESRVATRSYSQCVALFGAETGK